MYVTEIVEEMQGHGVPETAALLIAAKLIVIGEKSALYRATKGVVQEDRSIIETENIIAFCGRR